MPATLRWFGCTTFVLEVDGLRLMLDGYLNRVPAAPVVPARPDAFDNLDAILIGHSHSHHIADAPSIALRGKAPVVCHPVAAGVFVAAGVHCSQLRLAAGGERFRFSPTVTVRTLPSLHACDWLPAGQPATAFRGLDEDRRSALNGAERRLEDLFESATPEAEAIWRHLAAAAGTEWHGGVLSYLVEWSDGSLLFQDSIGAWSAVLAGIRPTVAILSAAGAPNLDGDPFPGSIEEFVALEAALLGWPAGVPCHHDNWMPPFTKDTGAFAPAGLLGGRAPTDVLRLSYGEPTSLPSVIAAERLNPLEVSCPVCGTAVRLVYATTDAEGNRARIVCLDCASLPEYVERLSEGKVALLSVPGLQAWTAARILGHASNNERSKAGGLKPPRISNQ